MRLRFHRDKIEEMASLFQGDLGRLCYKDFIGAIKLSLPVQEKEFSFK
jgi:hypothetical protein